MNLNVKGGLQLQNVDIFENLASDALVAALKSIFLLYTGVET